MSRWQWIGLMAAVGFWGYIVVSCKPGNSGGGEEPGPEPVTPVQTTPYTWTKPANFPAPVYNFAKNPLTVQGVQLGKALFYDGLLSRNGTITCGFCHSPFNAFAHTDHPLSHGINDQTGIRNVPAIQNVAWGQHFFWDGGIVDLDLLPIAPIQNPVEMGDSMTNVLAKVRQTAKYRTMFKAAFGTDSITTATFLKALSQFMLTLVSANSTYDKYTRGETGGDLSEEARRGLTLFKAKCAGCHSGELFTDQTFRNNGLPKLANARTDDKGRYTVTLLTTDQYKFRVPGLRNVEFTPPYMHDGRFQTLQQVIQHYATGVQDTPQLDPLLKQNGQLGIPLTAQEQKDLLAFLLSLTDYEFLNNRQFQPN
ncbi:cytochrome-c peroxidase [Arsenicibacter rosenii]|uniref:Cytochrome-c peroxidase n=1 Tax=Arsenicibacter rosenii TaxID=1750698 RepID=A0A1S2VJV6_9BACT|nr:cytochrome c peroxidase [Arsenicibacter rosenii]OIN59067.1 cytochrome-c peroxidase [Arsenicibacter rosenii]